MTFLQDLKEHPADFAAIAIVVALGGYLVYQAARLDPGIYEYVMWGAAIAIIAVLFAFGYGIAWLSAKEVQGHGDR